LTRQRPVRPGAAGLAAQSRFDANRKERVACRRMTCCSRARRPATLSDSRMTARKNARKRLSPHAAFCCISLQPQSAGFAARFSLAHFAACCLAGLLIPRSQVRVLPGPFDFTCSAGISSPPSCLSWRHDVRNAQTSASAGRRSLQRAAVRCSLSKGIFRPIERAKTNSTPVTSGSELVILNHAAWSGPRGAPGSQVPSMPERWSSSPRDHGPEGKHGRGCCTR